MAKLRYPFVSPKNTLELNVSRYGRKKHARREWYVQVWESHKGKGFKCLHHIIAESYRFNITVNLPFHVNGVAKTNFCVSVCNFRLVKLLSAQQGNWPGPGGDSANCRWLVALVTTRRETKASVVVLSPLLYLLFVVCSRM